MLWQFGEVIEVEPGENSLTVWRSAWQSSRMRAYGHNVAGYIVKRDPANIGLILRDAGMTFADVVQLNFYVTSRDDYAAARKEFGRVWRKHCGKHYPGMALFEVVSLFDPEARIEVQGIAAQ